MSGDKKSISIPPGTTIKRSSLITENLTSIPNAAPTAPLPEQARPKGQRYRVRGSQGSENTRRGYASDQRSYESFCAEHTLTAYPAETDTLIEYLAHLADEGRKLATIHRHLAAIQKGHSLKGMTAPTGTPEFKEVMQGIAREISSEQRQAPAFTVEYLKSRIELLDLTTATGLRDRALLLIGFAGAFRRSELVALNVEHLDFRGEALIIQMGRTKTNQKGAKQEKALFRGDNPLFCPITAYQQWLGQLDNRKEGPVFVSIHRGRTVGQGRPTANRLSDKSVNNIVQLHLGEFKKGEPYTAHSFRSSFITAAKLAGQSNEYIKNQTNHKSDAILQRYSRITDVVAHNAVKAVGL